MLYFTILLLLVQLASRAHSYSIEVESGDTHCFIVNAAAGIPCSGSFEVITPDPEPVVVRVTGPKNKLHFESKYKGDDLGEQNLSEGSFQFDADADGDYKMCISNGDRETGGDGVLRTVAFNFRAVANGQKDYEYAGLDSELAALRLGLDSLRDHQSYMNQRENVHKMTLESINTKVLCWTILEAVILIAMTVWQIYYISSFFETKRRL
jgi:hypothetical protein